MKCPSCGRDNSPRCRFCAACGCELARPQPDRPPDGEPARRDEALPAPVRAAGSSLMKCPTCGRDNAPHYRFCLGCGSELAKPQPDRPLDGAPDRQIEALLAEARDFEKFGMLDEAIDRMEKVVASPAARPEHRASLNTLRSRKAMG